MPSTEDPDVWLDVLTGEPVDTAFAEAQVPVDPADADAPTTTDVDHPTACLPKIDETTGEPVTQPLG